MSRRRPRLARRLVEPTWLTHPSYVETYGPEVADICDLAGYAPDPEQQLILDLIFAIGRNGKSAAFEIDIVGPRQNFKTGVIKQAELGWLFVTEERLIVHSAHEMDTTEEAFNELSQLIEDTPALSRHLAPTRSDRPGISLGNGRWKIELQNGQRLKYKARTKGGGRGLTGNKVVLDEAFALLSSHMGSLIPTLGAVPDPQVVSASSGCQPQSAVLRDKRKRGLARSSPRQVYVEYGDRKAGEGCAVEGCMHSKTARGCALDDEKRWASIMPALGRRVMVQTVRDMRQSMPPPEFAREFMVWHDEPDELDAGDLDVAEWNALEGVDTGVLKPLAFGVTVAHDRSRSWIGMAGVRGDDLVQIELVADQRGTRWPVQWLAERVPRWDPCAVVLDGTALSLTGPLEDEGIEVTTTTSRDRAQATVEFFDMFGAAKLRHPGEPQLDAAIENATKRPLGDGFVWEGELVGPLVSVTLALHGVLEHGRPSAPTPDPQPVRTKRGGRGGSYTSDLATAGF